MDIHDVESRHGDALEKHRANVPVELAVFHESYHAPSRIGAVPTHMPAHDTIQPRLGAHGPNQHDVAPMLSSKRPVVETDDVHAPILDPMAEDATPARA